MFCFAFSALCSVGFQNMVILFYFTWFGCKLSLHSMVPGGIWVSFCKYGTCRFAVYHRRLSKELNSFQTYVLYCLIVWRVYGAFTQNKVECSTSRGVSTLACCAILSYDVVVISKGACYIASGLCVVANGIQCWSDKFECFCNDGNRLAPADCVAIKMSCEDGK